MKAIITVIGKDAVGIIAKVTSLLAGNDVNILDISQTIMQGMFTMTMYVDISLVKDYTLLQASLSKLGAEIGVAIEIRNEDIFNAMHRL